MSKQPQHVVFMNLAATGHLNPTLPVVAELRSRGCEVTYFIDESMRSVVESAGARWRPFRYADGDETGTYFTLPKAGIQKYVPEGTPSEQYEPFQFCHLYNAEALLPTLLEDLASLVPPPQAIVYDPFLPFGRVAAFVLHLPAITLLTMPGPGVVAKPSAMTDDWEAKPWVEGPRREIQARYGIDLLARGILFEFYSQTMNIVTTIDELSSPFCSERQLERLEGTPFKNVGSIVDRKVPRVQNAMGAGAKAVSKIPLDQLDDAVKAGRRVLYVSLGTVATSKVFWERPLGDFAEDNGLSKYTGKQFTQHVFRVCFEAFGGDPSTLVVLSLGPGEDVLDGLPLVPNNFLVSPTAPQLEVLARCDAFVTHGGANSMHEALGFGVPLAVVPIFGDQPVNAETVAKAGAGFSFKEPMRTLTVPALRDAINEMVADGETNTYRSAAKEIADKLQKAGGARAAADNILEQIAMPNAATAGA